MMRRRWRFMFYSVLAMLAGIAWLDGRMAVSAGGCVRLASLFCYPFGLGMFCAVVVSCVCTVTNSRERWPAALVLFCVAPMTLILVAILAIDRGMVFEHGNVTPWLLIAAGGLGALASVGYVLAGPPPTVEDAIPRARLL